MKFNTSIYMSILGVVLFIPSLSLGMKMDPKDPKCLVFAIRDRDLEAVRTCLKAGANLDEKELGRSLLKQAVSPFSSNSIAIVRLLLEYGVKIEPDFEHFLLTGLSPEEGAQLADLVERYRNRPINFTLIL